MKMKSPNAHWMKMRISSLLTNLRESLYAYVASEHYPGLNLPEHSDFQCEIKPVKDMPGTIYVFIKDPKTGCCADAIGSETEEAHVVARARGYLVSRISRHLGNQR